ncbi:MAG: hypothetical protein VX320_02475, partial [Candidatus Thermoplasmatota archaeon]|nr:hypothetical protein [Candidatus Thermoplasmatota archaeon]MEE3082940.1 hypothetical protein [Candidatus Thermoplasmatota archaeon]
HITAKGRQQAELVAVEFGDVGIKVNDGEKLQGRTAELIALKAALKDDGFAIVTGMPGIGKTALLLELENSRMCTLNSSMDSTQLVGIWLDSKDPPRDIEAQIEMLSTIENTILIADEIQSVHERHREGIDVLLERLMQADEPPLAIGVRAPSPYPATIKLEGIAPEDGRLLLGESISEERGLEVAEVLDGHPLALHLWNPSDELPESSEAIQAFVENTVLSRLTENEKSNLDSISAEPQPVSANFLDALNINSLDDAALLRWPSGQVEVQHLVRNVRRITWSEPEKIHAEAAERWSQIKEPEARWFEAYHRTQAGENTTEFILENSNDILRAGSSAAVTILEDALNAFPNAHQLRRMAARIALDRGEVEFAESHLNLLPEPDYALKARLHRTNGNIDDAEKAEQMAISNASKSVAVEMRLSRIASELDDRLPDENIDFSRFQKALSEIEIGNLEIGKRRSAIVLLAILRHRISLLEGNLEAARTIRHDLASIGGEKDPIIERLEHLENLHLSSDEAAIMSAESAMRRLVERTTDPLLRVSLGLKLVQAQSRTNSPGSKTTLEQLLEVPLPLDMAAARRLDAMRWFWRGELDDKMRISCWREAVLRLRSAECPNAARSLTARLHRVLN